MQTTQFSSYIVNMNENQNLVLSMYYSATYLDETQAINVGKTCSQKFPLHMQFFTHLNILHVGMSVMCMQSHASSERACIIVCMYDFLITLSKKCEKDILMQNYFSLFSSWHPKLRGSSNCELNSGVQPEGLCSTDMALIALGNYFRSSKEYKNKADTWQLKNKTQLLENYTFNGTLNFET